MEEEQTAPTAEEVEQEESVVENEEATTSEEQEDSGDDTTAEQPEEKKAKGVQKRIDELVRQREEERRERLKLQEYIMQQQHQRQPEPEQAQEPQYPEVPPTPPDRYDYESDDQYGQAVQRYQQEQSAFVQGQIQKATRQMTEQQQQQQTQRQVQEGLKQIVDKGGKEFEDFGQVAFVPKGLESTFTQAENGHKIAYELGKNPEALQRITSLMQSNPRAAEYEIVRMDARMSLPQQKKPTKAPDPIKPVSGSETVTKDPDKLSIDEWMEKRRKGEIR